MKFLLFSTALLATGIAAAAAPVDGFYASVFGGYSYLSSNSNYYKSHHINQSYDNDYNFGGRFGYQSNPIRYEVEYTYLDSPLKKLHVDHINEYAPSGFTSANIIMANLYYDFPELLTTISPFLGVGIGYSFIKTNINALTPYSINVNLNENSFTYQGTAGLTYNFSENFALNAAYRYIATSSNSFGHSFEAQMGNVGIIYRFDTANYK